MGNRRSVNYLDIDITSGSQLQCLLLQLPRYVFQYRIFQYLEDQTLLKFSTTCKYSYKLYSDLISSHFNILPTHLPNKLQPLIELIPKNSIPMTKNNKRNFKKFPISNLQLISASSVLDPRDYTYNFDEYPGILPSKNGPSLLLTDKISLGISYFFIVEGCNVNYKFEEYDKNDVSPKDLKITYSCNFKFLYNTKKISRELRNGLWWDFYSLGDEDDFRRKEIRLEKKKKERLRMGKMDEGERIRFLVEVEEMNLKKGVIFQVSIKGKEVRMIKFMLRELFV